MPSGSTEPSSSSPTTPSPSPCTPTTSSAGSGSPPRSHRPHWRRRRGRGGRSAGSTAAPRRQPGGAARPGPPATPGRCPSASTSTTASAVPPGSRPPSGCDHLAILGPSGSGKSALLRCVAGINGPDPGPVGHGAAGRDDRCEVPAGRLRRPGLLPLPASDRVAPPALRGDATPSRAAYWLDRLHLDGLEDRYPDGDLGRPAPAGGPRPGAVPVPGDPAARRALVGARHAGAPRAPPRAPQLQQDTGLATVIVTHDPEEAAFLADELIVISDGRALQSGSTRDLFTRPSSPEVARLLGIANLYRAVVESDGWIDADGVRIAVSTGDMVPSTPVLWSIRPERVTLLDSGAPGYLLRRCRRGHLGRSIHLDRSRTRDTSPNNRATRARNGRPVSMGSQLRRSVSGPPNIRRRK